jgi:hypothetical protein
MRLSAWVFWATLIAINYVPAFAEVMDKEPTLPQIWGNVPQGIVIGFIACRLFPWFAVISLPYTLNHHFGVIEEMISPFIGPAMRQEAGFSYYAQVFLGAGLIVASHILGITLYQRAKRHLPTP